MDLEKYITKEDIQKIAEGYGIKILDTNFIKDNKIGKTTIEFSFIYNNEKLSAELGIAEYKYPNIPYKDKMLKFEICMLFSELVADIKGRKQINKIKNILKSIPPSGQDVYLKVAEIVRNELGLGLVEIQNNSKVQALEKEDELILRFIKLKED